MTPEKTRIEEFEVSGEEVLAKIKELLRQGNIRRVIIKSSEGRTLLEVPLTIGVVGALIAPTAAAIGALAAVVTKCTIAVERVEE
jgi:hypothetical protein